MSKQYLTAHTVDNAHTNNIFSIAVTPRALVSASGGSELKVFDTTNQTFTLAQTLSGAHELGCHHVCTSADGGRVAASAGFGGEIKVWRVDEQTGSWDLHAEVKDGGGHSTWAIALNAAGTFLAVTTVAGKIIIFDVKEKDAQPKIIREYDTGGAGKESFGAAVDLSRNGKWTASGHQNGTVYVFNNDTSRLVHSLTGLSKGIRAVAFSPGSTRLAAAGDTGTIALYDMQLGEPVGLLEGHEAWITSLDWSDTGEYLLSGSMDGKVKVWSIDRKACVATHSETDKPLWSVKWLPKMGRSEFFCTAGANKSLSFYREATGL